MKLKTPFKDLNPPLTSDEFSALKADIKAHGVREKVCIDEDGNVLDGHTRLRIMADAPTRVIRGLTDGQKEAFVFRSNSTRRNLSPDQKKAQRKMMKATAKKLRKEDPKYWTQAKVGAELGVARETVSKWFTTNGKDTNACKPRPDSRVKVPPTANPVIVDRLEDGESQEQVAADYGVTQQAISRLANKEKKRRDAKKEREKAVRKLKGNKLGIFTGDFREVGSVVQDNSVDLIFTDPPYDKKAGSAIYADLSEFAARVLRPGGWCLAYSGRWRGLDDMNNMAKHLTYGWMFACIHSGGCPRFRNLKVQVGWKPILGFYKPPLDVWWDWFADSASGGREKGHHEWQQAESEAAHFIEAMSPKKGLICDPFCGGGTTPAAAKRCGRKWIAIELDPEVAQRSRTRIETDDG